MLITGWANVPDGVGSRDMSVGSETRTGMLTSFSKSQVGTNSAEDEGVLRHLEGTVRVSGR
jgi:hypothetical protein